MNLQDNSFWTNASQAREALAAQLQDRSDVCWVDIGYPQDNPADSEISLRIHICETSTSDSEDTFPSEVDGVPVVVARVVERK